MEHALHNLQLVFVVRVAQVDDVEQQVRLDGFLEGGAERCEQVVGQATDEPDRVGEQDLVPRVDVDGAGRGVEGGEELVLDEDIGPGQGSHQSRLPGVRVAHQCHAEGARAALAARRHALADAVEFALQLADTAADQSAVDLELGLARAAHAGGTHTADGASTGLTGQVAPLPGQTRHQVVELGQLDLHLGGARAGMKGEDVENDGTAVEDALVGERLQVAHLRRRQFVVEDDHVGVAAAGKFPQLLRLALPHVIGGVDAFAVLQNSVDDDQRRRVGETGQFVEGLLRLPHGHAGKDDTGQQSGFLGDFGRMRHAGNIPGSGRRCQVADRRCQRASVA